MLENLTIKNIALIESLNIDFESGLNVFSGETGAGKSIIISALGLLLGGKGSTDSIRVGCNEASVAGSFFIHHNNIEARKWLLDHDIDLDDDRVLLRRTLKSNGRGNAWIQSSPVSRVDLQEFTVFLVDIHGQHDHQSLFKVTQHRKFLDAFAGIKDEVIKYNELYIALGEERKTLESLNFSEKERVERIDYLTYVIEEIEKANLKLGEDAELEAESKRLDEYEDLYQNLQNVDSLLSSEKGVIPTLKRAVTSLNNAFEIDTSLEKLYNRIESAYYELEDACNEVGLYFSRLSFDPVRVDTIQERLSFIYKLKKKYGASIDEVFEYKRSAEKELENLTRSEEDKNDIEEKIATLQSEILKRGRFISKKRFEAAEKLQMGVEFVLKNLGMNRTQFKVQVQGKQVDGNKQTAGPYGFDNIEFLISPNLGEPLKSLAKIASGGEVSRIMLALKTVLAKDDEVNTLIFDEIDTGIGGEVALNIASHMKSLSKNKQILCVTHLAVIAAHADNHIKIEKHSDGQSTHTYAGAIQNDKRVEEIARMLSGDGDSSASIAHARELLSKFS